jgi:BirA family biotin operon repressor/biotin-[acetyl-CoA-carboxylase] ligase
MGGVEPGVEPGADSLEPAAVEPLLRGAFGRPYRFVEQCESTQLLLGEDDPEGAVAACDEQTAGRGRLGRTWVAPAGTALLFSTLLRPPAERTAAELSLVAGLAVALGVERTLALAAQIKWPNDVMVNRRKVAGILAEARGDAVVLGIGLNVNQSRDELPDDTSVPAASLLTIDSLRRSRAALLADLLAELENAYRRWCEGGIDGIFDDLGPRDFLRNRRVALGEEEGTVVMIDRSGRLDVRVGGERRLLESGEVRVLG